MKKPTVLAVNPHSVTEKGAGQRISLNFSLLFRGGRLFIILEFMSLLHKYSVGQLRLKLWHKSIHNKISRCANFESSVSCTK